MATLTNEQIEQKKQQLHQLAVEAQAICKELVEADALELSEDDLDNAAGGGYITHTPRRPRDTGGIKEPWRGIIK